MSRSISRDTMYIVVCIKFFLLCVLSYMLIFHGSFGFKAALWLTGFNAATWGLIRRWRRRRNELKSSFPLHCRRWSDR